MQQLWSALMGLAIASGVLAATLYGAGWLTEGWPARTHWLVGIELVDGPAETASAAEAPDALVDRQRLGGDAVVGRTPGLKADAEAAGGQFALDVLEVRRPLIAN